MSAKFQNFKTFKGLNKRKCEHKIGTLAIKNLICFNLF